MKTAMMRAQGAGASGGSPTRKATAALKAFEARREVREVFDRVQRNPAYTVAGALQAFAKVKSRG